MRLHRWVILLSLTATTAFVPGCGDSPLAPDQPDPDPDLAPEVATFAEVMNAHRVGVGCQPLQWNPSVADVANAHSEDMITRDFFAHTNPDGDSPFDRLGAAEISYSRAAENIAWGFTTAESVLAAWLDSSGHRANIENCSLTEHGVGLVGTHWTHVFITP